MVDDAVFFRFLMQVNEPVPLPEFLRLGISFDESGFCPDKSAPGEYIQHVAQDLGTVAPALQVLSVSGFVFCRICFRRTFRGILHDGFHGRDCTEQVKVFLVVLIQLQYFGVIVFTDQLDIINI